MANGNNNLGDTVFSWAQWTPNTEFSLINVPWDGSYRDVVKFENAEKQDTYFSGLIQSGEHVTGGTMSRFGMPVRLRIPFNRSTGWNYLIAYNNYPSLETPRKWFYFIQETRYISAEVTEFVLQLDVWQSFQFNIEFGRCYIERGHIGIANDKQWENYGRDYLELPEGLDVGADYQINSMQWKGLAAANGSDNWEAGYLVSTTVNLLQNPGTVDDPKLNTAQGSKFAGLVGGASIYYLKDSNDFSDFMRQLSDYPWVSQGISAIWAVPPIADNLLIGGPLLGKQGNVTTYIPVEKLINGKWVRTGRGRVEFMRIQNFRDRFKLPERYKNLRKFLTYPYATIEMTPLNGQAIIIKPEQVSSNDLGIDQQYMLNMPNPRVNWFPVQYNTSIGVNPDTRFDSGEWLDFAVGVQDFPRFSIVNNSGIAYLASTAHSRAYSFQSADWANQKTQMGINNALAATGIENQYANQGNTLAQGNRNAMLGISQNQATQSTAITTGNMQANQNISNVSGAVSGAAGVLGNAASGNIGGAVGSAVGAGVSMWAQNATLANNIGAANAQTALSNSTAAASTSQANTYGTQSTQMANQQRSELADLNAGLARATASGDYANAIAGINAKVQDAKLMQPSVSGAVGGDAFNFANNIMGLQLKWKQISPAAMRSIGEFWLRYGYYVQRFTTPPKDLACMSKFTFWKMQEAYVFSTGCPEFFRLTIKGIFEKGVTVWNNANDIGRIDYADNQPLNGIEI